MPSSDPLILAFDTSAAHCAAALVSGDTVLAEKCEEMARGQAERLVGLLEAVLAEAGKSWNDLDRIGVGVGPGNFTGIRISVAAARGMALGLGIPAIGVSSFDTVAPEASGIPAVPGPRGQAYIAPEGQAPYLASVDEIAGMPLVMPERERIARQIARVAASAETGAAPKPFYIKPTDAAPPRDAPPRILDDA